LEISDIGGGGLLALDSVERVPPASGCARIGVGHYGIWGGGSMVALSIVAVFTISMVVAGRIAGSRGRSQRAWIWLAFVFGPLAALAARVLPAKPVANQAGATAS
jgi:hypothetical protein